MPGALAFWAMVQVMAEPLKLHATWSALDTSNNEYRSMGGAPGHSVTTWSGPRTTGVDANTWNSAP
jgi:hypothetical protein